MQYGIKRLMSFIVRTVFLCTALNVVAACSQRQSVQPVAEAAVHVSSVLLCTTSR